jgi:sulfur dioxygenase
MKFRQLFDAASASFTYVVGDENSGEALIIDPVFPQFDRDCALLAELGLTPKYAFDTHLHADHRSALGAMKNKFGCQTGISRAATVDCADLKVKDQDRFFVGEIPVVVMETPGHTAGCVSYRVEDRVFTGDTLLVRGCGRTDFQGGDASKLFDSATLKLFALPDDTLVYPGHDYKGFTVSTIGEEKKFNPRFSLSKAEFVTLMSSLNLDFPEKMESSVPWNANCGRIGTLER